MREPIGIDPGDFTPEALAKISPPCDYCGERAALVSGKDAYPHRPDLATLWLWQCAPCGAWVGVHKGTFKPKGRLADAEGLEHFGRTEFEEPACRRPYRSQDASGSPESAGQVGWTWLKGIAEREHEKSPTGLELDTPRFGHDGGAMMLYRDCKLIAAAIVIRDPMNFAVLVRWLPAVETCD